LVDMMEAADAGAGTVVRMSRRLPPGAPPLTAERMGDFRAQPAAPDPAAPLDETAAHHRRLTAALEEVRAQRDELARLNAELDRRSAQLHAASEAKSRFLANVSHELRAPVTAIIGLSRLLTDPSSDPLTGEQSRQIGLIHSSATDLLGLVTDLLDLAKVEAGRIEPIWTDVDLRTVFGQLRGTLRALDTRPDVELLVDDPTPGAAVHSDEVLLTRVLRNLLVNALAFTERGEVRLRAAWPADGGRVELIVSDTGIGIPAELHERIFEEFYQVPDGPTVHGTGTGTGTGLGLPYARRLVTLLGGCLRVASEPGRGSVFTVTLPVRNGA
jgi:signal transduction histidine kinase